MYQSRIYKDSDYVIHMSRMDEKSFVVISVTGKSNESAMLINWKEADKWITDTIGLTLTKEDYIDCDDTKPTLTGIAS